MSFTGLAAAGAIAAYREQRAESQRLQLQYQHEQIISRFHELLRHWRTAVSEIEIEDPTQKISRKGIDAIMMIENEFLAQFSNISGLYNQLLLAHEADLGTRLGVKRINHIMNKSFIALPLYDVQQEFHELHESRIGGQLGHVLRMMRELLCLIHDAKSTHRLNPSEVDSLVRAFKVLLSDPELHIMLYWGLSDRASKFCRDIIDEYDFLEGLVEKEPLSVQLRTPELLYYPHTYKRWRSRHHGVKIEAANEPEQV